jgi:hypothetical protein
MPLPTPRNAISSWVLNYAKGLRFPTLFILLLVVFVLDLIIPDVIPLADELILGLLTLLVGTWKRRRSTTG